MRHERCTPLRTTTEWTLGGQLDGHSGYGCIPGGLGLYTRTLPAPVPVAPVRPWGQRVRRVRVGTGAGAGAPVPAAALFEAVRQLLLSILLVIGLGCMDWPTRHRLKKLVAAYALGLTIAAAQSPPDGADWMQFSAGVEITFEERNTTVFIGEHYDYYANRIHAYFLDDSGGSPTWAESATDLNTSTYYRMDENLPGGCGVYPMNTTSNAARFVEGSSFGTATPHVRMPADFLMRGTIQNQRYLKDETVRGIACETFQYKDSNIEFGGPGLMGRKVDITMLVLYGKASRLPVQTLLSGTHLDDMTPFRHIYTYAAFRPWLDTTFQGFNLTRYQKCRQYLTAFKDWVYQGAATSKRPIPVAAGKPPSIPQLADSFEVMTEGAFKGKNFSTAIFEAFDYANNSRSKQAPFPNRRDVYYLAYLAPPSGDIAGSLHATPTTRPYR